MPAERPVLVTGANGFIGSHLVEALLGRGYRVRCLVRRTSDISFIRHLPVEWAYADLNDGGGLDAACRDVHAVCHCAGLTRAIDDETFMRVNADGTEALARACLRAAPGVERFLFVSSIAAAGPAPSLDGALRESSAPRPITWYGKSKLAAENALFAMADRLPVTILRPAIVFGPRDRDLLAYFRLVRRGLELQLGTVERWVSLIYVRDLISLILLSLASEPAVGQIYYASCTQCTRRALGHSIARALNRRTVSITLPFSVLAPFAAWSSVQARLTGRPGLLNGQRAIDMRQRYWLFSGERAGEELGFKPQFDLDSAVSETARWYQENRWL